MGQHDQGTENAISGSGASEVYAANREVFGAFGIIGAAGIQYRAIEPPGRHDMKRKIEHRIKNDIGEWIETDGLEETLKIGFGGTDAAFIEVSVPGLQLQ